MSTHKHNYLHYTCIYNKIIQDRKDLLEETMDKVYFVKIN